MCYFFWSFAGLGETAVSFVYAEVLYLGRFKIMNHKDLKVIPMKVRVKPSKCQTITKASTSR